MKFNRSNYGVINYFKCKFKRMDKEIYEKQKDLVEGLNSNNKMCLKINQPQCHVQNNEEGKEENNDMTGDLEQVSNILETDVNKYSDYSLDSAFSSTFTQSEINHPFHSNAKCQTTKIASLDCFMYNLEKRIEASRTKNEQYTWDNLLTVCKSSDNSNTLMANNSSSNSLSNDSDSTPMDPTLIYKDFANEWDDLVHSCCQNIQKIESFDRLTLYINDKVIKYMNWLNNVENEYHTFPVNSTNLQSMQKISQAYKSFLTKVRSHEEELRSIERKCLSFLSKVKETNVVGPSKQSQSFKHLSSEYRSAFQLKSTHVESQIIECTFSDYCDFWIFYNNILHLKQKYKLFVCDLELKDQIIMNSLRNHEKFLKLLGEFHENYECLLSLIRETSGTILNGFQVTQAEVVDVFNNEFLQNFFKPAHQNHHKNLSNLFKKDPNFCLKSFKNISNYMDILQNILLSLEYYAQKLENFDFWNHLLFKSQSNKQINNKEFSTTVKNLNEKYYKILKVSIRLRCIYEFTIYNQNNQKNLMETFHHWLIKKEETIKQWSTTTFSYNTVNKTSKNQIHFERLHSNNDDVTNDDVDNINNRHQHKRHQNIDKLVDDKLLTSLDGLIENTDQLFELCLDFCFGLPVFKHIVLNQNERVSSFNNLLKLAVSKKNSSDETLIISNWENLTRLIEYRLKSLRDTCISISRVVLDDLQLIGQVIKDGLYAELTVDSVYSHFKIVENTMKHFGVVLKKIYKCGHKLNLLEQYVINSSCEIKVPLQNEAIFTEMNITASILPLLNGLNSDWLILEQLLLFAKSAVNKTLFVHDAYSNHSLSLNQWLDKFDWTCFNLESIDEVILLQYIQSLKNTGNDIVWYKAIVNLLNQTFDFLVTLLTCNELSSTITISMSSKLVNEHRILIDKFKSIELKYHETNGIAKKIWSLNTGWLSMKKNLYELFNKIEDESIKFIALEISFKSFFQILNDLEKLRTSLKSNESIVVICMESGCQLIQNVKNLLPLENIHQIEDEVKHISFEWERLIKKLTKHLNDVTFALFEFILRQITHLLDSYNAIKNDREQIRKMKTNICVNYSKINEMVLIMEQTFDLELYKRQYIEIKTKMHSLTQTIKNDSNSSSFTMSNNDQPPETDTSLVINHSLNV